MQNEPIRIHGDQARQGVTGHNVIRVLVVGLILSVIAFVLVWFVG